MAPWLKDSALAQKTQVFLNIYNFEYITSLEYEVLIKITYIAELQVEEDAICFNLPASVAPWLKDSALAQKTQVFLNIYNFEYITSLEYEVLIKITYIAELQV